MSQNLQTFVKFQKIQLENLVDFEKCCKTRIYLQRSAPIQPKTSDTLRKICQKRTPSSSACGSSRTSSPSRTGSRYPGLLRAARFRRERAISPPCAGPALGRSAAGRSEERVTFFASVGGRTGGSEQEVQILWRKEGSAEVRRAAVRALGQALHADPSPGLQIRSTRSALSSLLPINSVFLVVNITT